MKNAKFHHFTDQLDMFDDPIFCVRVKASVSAQPSLQPAKPSTHSQWSQLQCSPADLRDESKGVSSFFLWALGVMLGNTWMPQIELTQVTGRNLCPPTTKKPHEGHGESWFFTAKCHEAPAGIKETRVDSLISGLMNQRCWVVWVMV